MFKFLFQIATVSVASISILTFSTETTKAQEYSGCFMIGQAGEYIDLNHVCNGGKKQVSSLKDQFFQKIQKIGVSIVYEKCRAGLLGSYHPGLNKMTVCQNNITSNDLFIETLAHESWHLVQDCVGNLNDGIAEPVTKGNAQWFKSMIKNLNASDLDNLSLYESQDLPHEVEAFAMEKHPDLVLKGLDACANHYLAQK